MNLHRNSEGYYDPTPYPALREETEQENRMSRLVHAVRCIIDLAGFELVGRIVLRDKKSGRMFR